MWEPSELKKLDISLDGNQLRGHFRLETADEKRGFQGDFRGIVEVKDHQVVRFDVVARGEFWGEGPYTRNPPPGKFPFAVTFRLADGTDEADRVRPQGSRGWIEGYLGREP